MFHGYSITFSFVKPLWPLWFKPAFFGEKVTMTSSNSQPFATRPLHTILIANRGEIAVRVIRACRELGLRSVAVYSDADRHALHVRLADEAQYIGPPPATQSYLNFERILDAARRANADAIHPGYGFLSENPDFVAACRAARIVFIGPPAEVQRQMGEKTAARRAAQAAHVPIVPGTLTDLEDVDQATRLAQEIGYPVLLKAAAGGGGKGIRLVNRPEELAASLRAARSEASSSFGDSSVYLEKAITPARHIEVQILADMHGHVVHLGERECSIQRRHQKLIEESPSSALDDDLRARFTSAAVSLAASIGYVNAGTVEFLLGPDRTFYFLEVNTRLQVEHPVTEWRTGLDLVREQIRIAAGLPLSVRQEDIAFHGSAIECRISAEDPFNRFLPATGTIAALQEPAGPGVRVDSGAYQGMQVPLFYDPLLSKLIVWAQDRAMAIDRMRRALREYTIAGLRTTIPFHRFVMDSPRFQRGEFSTDFIAEEWHGAMPAAADEDAVDSEYIAALAAAMVAVDSAGASQRRHGISADRARGGSRWRDLARREATGSRY
jgi:acetyl-CoA carboxylase biotin carboxylase subunit